MKKVSVTSLGCDKNLTDSEQMTALLKNGGFEICERAEDADVMIVNTCAFVEDAKRESINQILELAQYKSADGGEEKLLIVTGCLAQRYKDEILREMPEVDAVVGVNEYDKISDIIEARTEGGSKPVNCSETPLLYEGQRVRSTPKYTAFLKIAEGCDNRCTYCVIPYIRGPYRSRKAENILAEAEALAREGVKELIVIAQDTTRYGIDLYGEYRLPALLKELCAIDGIEWVRVHYCYPELVTDELIETFKTEPKLCNYFDIPIQHSADGILKRMGRRTNRARITQVINKIRREIPNAAIRTTLMVGFPGETEEDMDDLIRFIYEAKLDRVGVFAYSREEGTPAYDMPDQIDEEEKRRRLESVIIAQADVDDEKNSAKIGTVQTVLVEGFDEDMGRFRGRTYADSVDVDGLVFFDSEADPSPGDFVKVQIEDAWDMSLFGKVWEERPEG